VHNLTNASLVSPPASVVAPLVGALVVAPLVDTAGEFMVEWNDGWKVGESRVSHRRRE
jgi:hypothetical protein